MRLATSTIVALLATPFLAFAQSSATSGAASTTVAAGQATSTANPFKVPSSGIAGSAGQSLTLNWQPTTSGTVSLILRSGSSNNLNAGTAIASNIQNSGSYTWQIPSSIVRGSDYAVEIVDDSDSSETNYTPYFVIDSSNTVASASSSNVLSSTVTSGAPSSSLSLSTASNTLSSTHTGSSSSGAATGSSASKSGSSSMSTATSSGAPLQTSSAAASATKNAAPRASAAAGAIGLIALGAFAL